jgi:acetyl esterase
MTVASDRADAAADRRSDPPQAGLGALGTVLALVLSLVSRLLFAMPDRLLRAVFGRPPEVASGLAPDAWAIARFTELIERDPYLQTPDQARQVISVLSAGVASRERPEVETDDMVLDLERRSIRARLYRPSGVPDRGPLLVYFHGGGFVVGSLETHDHALRILADRSRVSLLSVEYRKAPEHRFPAGVDDALAAWEAVSRDPSRFGADPDRIGVGGDSAGGNLAAVLCQDLKRLGSSQPAFQMLIYPVTVIGGAGDSYRDFGEGFFLTGRGMDWYADNYLGGQDRDQARVAPLLCDDLSGLAPAYVTTALADPLRDEGESYAARLFQAGVPVRLDRMPLVHGWFNTTGSRSAQAAMDVLAGVLAENLGPNE